MFSKMSYMPRLASCNSICLQISRNFAQSSKPDLSKPGRVVFISQSSDVFANLAFENWVYSNMTFEKKEILFLWSNSPCVVIGRHQNPYVESNLLYLENADIPFARRKSGGGTVYHDRGNLNCTFFTTRNRYNRKWNLEVIAKSLSEDFQIKSKIDCKDNIIIEDSFKVSGTAAKLGRLSAYHHCTLLVDSNRQQLKLCLEGDKTINSNATASVPAPVKNLIAHNSELTVEKLYSSIGRKYLEASDNSANRQESCGFTLINPADDWFPGLGKIKEELESWNWKFGMTPKFIITRPIEIPSSYGSFPNLNVSIETYHGIIKEVRLSANDAPPYLVKLIDEVVGSGLKGARYSPDVFNEISVRLRLPSHLISQSSA